MHKEKSPYSEEFIIYVAAQFFREQSEMEDWALAPLNCVSWCAMHSALCGRDAGAR